MSLRSEQRIGNPKHGLWYTPAYKAYYAMRTRCLNPAFHAFHRYGGRGISICDRWLHSFENFYADMGQPPEGYTLERVNNDGDYAPANCKWASRAEQAVNMRRSRKITASQAEEIRRIAGSENRGPYTAIAKTYGISAALVCRIAKGQAWNRQ
jgi:hypothetical protein